MSRRICCGALAVAGWLALGGCQAEPKRVPAQAAAPAAPGLEASPARTRGFDGRRALAHVERLVAMGPRTPASEASRQAQAYLRRELQAAGCAVEEDDFAAVTPLGRVPMKNIVARAAGKRPGVVLFLTHYDTARLPAFLGANDGGSSTGVMLELARHLCARTNELSVWIAFLDGEEAQVRWSETDGLYGSRQLAARLANAGELKRVRAVILADLVGYRELRLRREANSTPWLVDLVWSTAARLGYEEHFVAQAMAVEDDHVPFLRRGIPAVDLIQLDDYPHWHTPEDTLDKLSPRSLAIVGHVLLEVLPELEGKFR